MAFSRSRTKIAGSAAGFGSIDQRHEIVDTDPYQNVTDPQLCWYVRTGTEYLALDTLVTAREGIRN